MPDSVSIRPPAGPLDLFAGGGDMGARMRSYRWADSPLGPAETWPQSLKTAVRIMLTSRQPMFVWWGGSLINLYNDAYRAILGGKHPAALGMPAAEVWKEIWDQVEPRVRAALAGNEGTYDEALLLIMRRNGYPEETYYTFSYSPIPDDRGGTGGILCANTDDTRLIISGRRMALLGELAARTSGARSWREVCAQAAAALGTSPKSIPFAMIYIAEPDSKAAILAGAVRIRPGGPLAPERVDLAGPCPWPLREALETGRMIRIPAPADSGPLPTGAWDQPPHQVVCVPFSPPGSSGRRGVLVAGPNPFRPLDEEYAGFLTLLASQIASSLATAQAYEDERKRAEGLAELDRAKTAFFSNVSHEFRTPLTLIMGPLEDALRTAGAAGDAVQSERLEMIRRNGLRLLKLVNNLLDFSRLEAGRAVASFQPVDLCRLTGDLASVFRSAITQAGLDFMVECDPLPGPVYVDPDMWERIVLNLLSNALKFTFRGRIAVRIGVEGERAVLRVSDTGVGIPPEELPRIFTRFHRVQGAHSRTHEGSGIGLALVQELARMHGGDAAVESEAGRGTVFTVSVPFGSRHLPPDRIVPPSSPAGSDAPLYVEEASRWLPGADRRPREKERAVAKAKDGASGEPAAAGTRPRILLADDNRDMREYVARILSAHWDVESVPDGLKALERARENPPDLVLSDVMMPGLDGFRLLKALRAEHATESVPVILLSARAGEESTEEALRTGADDYLVKPFSGRELVARVAARLEIDQLRRRQEREIHKFRSLVEQSNDFISIGNLDGDPLYINAEGRRLVGLPPGRDLHSVKAEDFYFPEDRPGLAPVREEIARTGRWQGEVRMRHFGTGKAIPVWLNAFVLRDGAAGEPIAIATVTRDLSRLRETEENLRQAQKMEAIGKLAGGIAHDFNNLLTGINGFAELALAMPAATGELRDYLDEIRKSGERAALLTNQLLAYSRKQMLAPKILDLNAVLADMETLLRRLIGEDIELVSRLEPDLGRVRADPGQLQQIILNLALNARDAMPDGGRLVLETANMILDERFLATHLENKPGPYVMLSVSDTGIGMGPDVLPHIFEPFFTTKPIGSDPKGRSGTGLGLSSVYGIVKQSEGGIDVESAPGRGSVFKIYLPLVPGGGTEPGSPAAAPAARAPEKGTLLLVEDEDSVRRFVRKALESRGYRVLEAKDGAEALEIAGDGRGEIRLLITDMVMPRMGGRKLAERFRILHPGTRILMMSGYTDLDIVSGQDRESGWEYLQKPFRPDQLLAAVDGLLGRAE